MAGDYTPLERTVALIDGVAARMAAADGLNWAERCPYEEGQSAETADCGSGTCVAAHYEDHDPEVARAWYRRHARVALAAARDALASAGELQLQAYRAADPDAQPDGTSESLATCALMLETWGPDCFPVNDQGQVHFARCMMDATAAEIRAYLGSRQDRG